ncbi:hypothetical protein ElyMa_000589000 [Elysia marginata]|uniref:Uncharacterized protein n=1 Tax=Elysia marginata TaxID=1093978 RepID=A0AAV4G874_9GAST|nr:hypothetical protein ElyMa_000589000 [Elysia marginata]
MKCFVWSPFLYAKDMIAFRKESWRERLMEGVAEGEEGRPGWATSKETSQMKMCEVCETALARRRWRTVTAHFGDGMAPS